MCLIMSRGAAGPLNVRGRLTVVSLTHMHPSSSHTHTHMMRVQYLHCLINLSPHKNTHKTKHHRHHHHHHHYVPPPPPPPIPPPQDKHPYAHTHTHSPFLRRSSRRRCHPIRQSQPRRENLLQLTLCPPGGHPRRDSGSIRRGTAKEIGPYFV